MGVRSFLVYVAPETRDQVAQAIRADPCCAVYPAENRDVLVIVTDLSDRDAEEAFDERLGAVPGVLSVVLVAGYAR
jgi:nitrate reductase NapAB chaperone NapD